MELSEILAQLSRKDLMVLTLCILGLVLNIAGSLILATAGEKLSPTSAMIVCILMVLLGHVMCAVSSFIALCL